MKRQWKKFRWAGAILLGLSAGYFAFHHPLPYSNALSMEISLKARKENTFLLVINGHPQGKTLRETDRWQIFRFTLEGPSYNEIKFTLGTEPDTILIRSVTVKSAFQKRIWPGERLKVLFSRLRGLSSARFSKEGMTLESQGLDQAYLVLSEQLHPMMEEMGRSRIFPYLWSGLVFLSILFLFPALNFRRFHSLRPCLPRFPALLFLAFLFLPAIDEFFHISKRWPLEEKRTLNTRPLLNPAQIEDYPREFERYYSDHFGLRPLLIRLYHQLKIRFLHVSPNPFVLLGREGWLFLDRENERRDVIDYYLGQPPFSPDELTHWMTILRQRRDWLKKRGVEYLLVFAPDKTSIYPEFLPSPLPEMKHETRLDQLLQAMNRPSDDFILDLRPALISAKTENLVFFKTDTHWNEFGGFIAYHETFNRLSRNFSGLHPIAQTAFRFETRDEPGGDLAIMLTMPEYLREQAVRRIHLNPLTAKEFQLPPMPESAFSWSGSAIPGSDLPRAVMFRDSYAHQFLDLFSEHFSRIVYIWDWDKRFFSEIIKKENPRIVIEEMAERFLAGFKPINPPEVH